MSFAAARQAVAPPPSAMPEVAIPLPTMRDLHTLSDDLDSIDQTLAELDAE